MNKRKMAALLLCAVLGGSKNAAAEAIFDGVVIAGETLSITAPFGGTVKSIALREGALLEEGEAIATLETTRVYAPEDGTVRGLRVQSGDSVEEGAVLYIAPVSKYTVNASIDKAYESVDTLYVNVGEKVYIRCTADGTHKAEGIITAADGDKYTIQTQAGELYLGEKVYIYRSGAYEAQNRVGSGTVARTAEVAINAKGSLLALHVEEGEVVERGQLLFETVEGTMEALEAKSSTICATQSGIVATVSAAAGAKVEKGAVLATVYPRERFQIEIEVPEDMLGQITLGDKAQISFYRDEGAGKTYEGTIQDISFVQKQNSGQESTGTVVYSTYIAFEADERIRLGMTASVVLPGVEE